MATRDCICFACDAAYLPHFATALVSLAENSPGHDVFLFGDGLPQDQIALVRTLADDLKVALTILDTRNVSFAGLAKTEVYSRAAWIRVFIAHMLPNSYRRMLYLDCDLVVLAGLDELIGMDLAGNVAAAAENRPESISIREKLALQMPGEAKYFNTGVFLVDLELWRQRQISSEVLAFAAANPDKLAFVDQSAINRVCWQQIRGIEPRFNYGAASGIERHPVILHFHSRTKPWLYADAPGFELYEYYRNKTPYKLVCPVQRKHASSAAVARKLRANRFLHRLGFDRQARIGDLQKWHDRLETIEAVRQRLKEVLRERLA